MPYFITDKMTGCDGWAVLKDNGDILACHPDKQSAIDQMVAVSLHENIKPGGEWQTNASNQNERTLVKLKQKETRMETRHFNGTISGLEIRAEGDGRTFSGYAALFNADSEPMGGFTERIAPGAFTRSLKSHGWDVKLLANHDPGRVLGSTRAKTLRLVEDERGLRVEATLPDNTDGRDIAESIRRGDIDAMSFGFTTQPQGDTWSADGKTRTLTDVKLYEVSIVAWPAYPSTGGTTSVRSLATRSDINAEELQGAIDALVTAESLTPEQAALINNVVEQLVIKNETAMPEVEAEVTIEISTELPVTDLPMEAVLNQLALKLKGVNNGN